jgi:hypothetical protein
MPLRQVAFLSVSGPAWGHGNWSGQVMAQGDLGSWFVAGSYSRQAPATHMYDVGISYSTQRFTPGSRWPIAVGSEGTRSAGLVYGIDEWRLSPRARLTYGARYARYDYLGGSGLFSPHVGLTLIPVDGLRLQGVISRRMAVAWVASLAVIALVGAAALGTGCVVAFGGAVALEVAYCTLRSVTWMKTFVSGAMVGLGGLAGWLAVAPLSAAAVPVFALLAVWEIAGRNLPNDLADIEADSAVALRTVATTFGPRVAAGAPAVGAVATAGLCLVLPAPPLLRVAALVCAGWSMLLPARRLLARPVPAEAAGYFNRASLFPALAFAAGLVFYLAR